MHIKPKIQSILSFSQSQKVDLLRLDLLHPIVSGNKFYKLQFYNAAAIENGVSWISEEVLALSFERDSKLKPSEQELGLSLKLTKA